MDETITHAINSLSGQSAWIDSAVIAFTQYGVPFMILEAIAYWWLPGPRLQQRQTAIIAGLSFLISLLINQIILLFIHRMRPYDAGISHLIIAKTADWSFPSDHATASCAIAFAVLFGGLRKAAIGLFVTAFIICFSRIYVGMHYVTDIIGGAGVALVTTYIANRFYPRGSKFDRWLVSWF